MHLTDLIIYRYYKFFSKDGAAREPVYRMRSGLQSPEDRTFTLFCLTFLWWLILVALLINELACRHIRTLNGFYVCILFVPFYLFFNKKYNTGFEIVAVYEKIKMTCRDKAAGIVPAGIYSLSWPLLTVAVFAIAVFRIQ